MARRLLGIGVALAAAVALGGCFAIGQESVSGFTATPDPAETDRTVTFDAFSRGASEPDNAKVSWDLDGNGTFETFTGSGLVASASYSTPGFRAVGLDVAYPAGFIPGALFATAGLKVFLHEYFTRGVTVVAPPPPQPPPGQPPANQPPTASFSHDADPGYAETPVKFDAGASGDPEGASLTYEWDFGDTHSDDDTLTTKSATATYRYDFSGDYIVRLRVFDDAGLSAETTRMVQVVAGSPPSALSGTPLRSAARGTPFALTLAPSALTEGTTTVTNGALLQTGITARGRLALGRRLARPLNRTRSPRWTARFMVKQRGSLPDASFAVEGQMLFDFGRGVRVCTATRATFKPGRPANGRLSVIGGSGAAARTGGRGTFAVTLTDRLSVRGRAQFTKRRRALRLPPECRTLARLR